MKGKEKETKKEREAKLDIARMKAGQAINQVNQKIDELGRNTKIIHDKITELQIVFDAIRNIPSEKYLEYKKLQRIRLNWKQQAEKIELDYRNAEIRSTGAGAAGVGLGAAIVALGPTTAMGVATTFGVASTGTAISALSGAAATNAALAWLGGGALAAGGGGMVAGQAFLALVGPVGWAIAGISILTSGFFLLKGQNDKKRLENIFTLISKRDIKSYELAIVEINERIYRIIDESEKLSNAIERIKLFGFNYDLMTEAQQYELGAYVNLMNASTQLLINPIKGLLPKYCEHDFEIYLSSNVRLLEENEEKLIISLANLLYKIDMDTKDKKLIWKSLKKNKEFLKSVNMPEQNLKYSIMEVTFDALQYKYRLEEEIQNI